MLYLIYIIIPVLIVIVALSSVRLTGNFIPIITKNAQLTSLDGFRGILAVSVFIHHSLIWKNLLLTDKWEWPSLSFYVHLGSDAVAFFFMITSFLFIGKLKKDKSRQINWKHLYTNRIKRIIPLYLLMALFIFIIVGIKTGWTLQTNKTTLIRSLLHWLTAGIFKIDGTTTINNYQETFIIVCGVVWSLSYEWLFYVTLPIWDIILNKKYIKGNIIAGIAALLIAAFLWYYNKFAITTLLYFISGVIAVFLFGNKYVTMIARNKWTPLLIIVVLISAVKIQFHGFIFILTPIFILIVNECNFWGILTSNAMRRLGEISYSIYLLHGIFLYVSFRLLLPRNIGTMLAGNDFYYWGYIIVLTFLLILFCQITFKYIELKFMRPRSKSQ